MHELRRMGYRVGLVEKFRLHKKSQTHGIGGWSERLGRLGFADTVDKRDTPIIAGRITE